MSGKKRIIVICPGRGSYTKENLNSFEGISGEKEKIVAQWDEWRSELGELTLSELDGAKKFSTSLHTKGEHASPLIFGCAYLDFLSIDREKYEIVAITGNSMGWYLALAFAGAMSERDAFHLVQTMGAMMKDELIGGQIIYPVVDDQWREAPEREIHLAEVMEKVSSQSGSPLYRSIELGGYCVLGGPSKALSALVKELSPVGDFPIRLVNHGAFHTPLMEGVSAKALNQIPRDAFLTPKINLIDGRGKIFSCFSSQETELHDYTLKTQVLETYSFTKAVEVALKEYAPDHLVLLGPGSSLGGAIGQIIVENLWHGIDCKENFIQRQKESPFLLSMGIPEQRERVVKNES